MDTRMVTRNVAICGKRTTVRLESAVWAGLDEICLREKLSRHEVCSRIDRQRHGVNRAQAIRAAVVTYYRLALRGGPEVGHILDRALSDTGVLAA